MDLAAKHNPHQNIIDKVTSFKDLKNDFFFEKKCLGFKPFCCEQKIWFEF